MTDATTTTHSRLFGRDLLYVVIGSLQLVTATFVSPITAHIMPTDQFGRLASAIALFQVLSVSATLGIDQALVLRRAEEGDSVGVRRLVTAGVALGGLCTLVAAASSPLWAPLVGFGGHPLLVAGVLVWMFIAAGIAMPTGLLLAEDRLRPFAIAGAVAAIGQPVGGLVLVLLIAPDAESYVLGGLAGPALALLIGLIAARPAARGLVDLRSTGRAARFGVPLMLSGLSYLILTSGDRIVIQAILGPEEVGRYQIAYVVGSAVILMLQFTSSAWTPRFAALRSYSSRVALAAHSRDGLYRLLLPAVLGVALGTPAVLQVVAPARLTPPSSDVVVLVVALSAFPVAAGVATGRLLLTLHRTKTILAVTTAAAVVNIALNLLLVPVAGILGAAGATLITYVLLAAVQRFWLPREPRVQRSPLQLRLGIAAVVVAAAATLLIPDVEWVVIVRFVLAVACLPWFYFALRRARRGDLGPADLDDSVDVEDEATGIDPLQHGSSRVIS